MQAKNWLHVVNRILLGIVFLVLMALFWKGLQKEPLISEAIAQNTTFPQFNLLDILKNRQMTLQEIKPKPFVVHIWATWCGSCLQEHPFWVMVQRKYNFPLVGILYRDKAQKAKSILASRGDPYSYLLDDPSGGVGMDLGLMGVPATYVVDARGKIRYVHFGELSMKEFEKNILPYFRKGSS